MTLILVPKTARNLTEVPLEDRRAAPKSQRIGVLLSRAYEGGPEQAIDIVSCVHCQAVWPWVRGSGNLRGWCCRCNGFFCGPECEMCVPALQMLHNMGDHGGAMPFDQAKRHRPITASVPAGVPASKDGILLGRG